MLTYRLLSEADKEAVSAWRYEGDYALYNTPPYSVQKAKGWSLANPAYAKCYYGYWDGDKLVGYTNIKEKSAAVFLGVGVAPESCSQGYGTQIMKLAVAQAKELYPGKPCYLEVRSWNRRAIRCYEKAGFVIQGEPFEMVTLSGPGQFIKMVYRG